MLRVDDTQGVLIESIMCLNATWRVKFMCADFEFRKKCPHMLRSDHRELRNS